MSELNLLVHFKIGEWFGSWKVRTRCLFCALLVLITRKWRVAPDSTAKALWCNTCTNCSPSASVSPSLPPALDFATVALWSTPVLSHNILPHQGLGGGRSIDFSTMCRSDFRLLEFCTFARYTEIQTPAPTTLLWLWQQARGSLGWPRDLSLPLWRVASLQVCPGHLPSLDSVSGRDKPIWEPSRMFCRAERNRCKFPALKLPDPGCLAGAFPGSCSASGCHLGRLCPCLHTCLALLACPVTPPELLAAPGAVLDTGAIWNLPWLWHCVFSECKGLTWAAAKGCSSTDTWEKL